MLNVVALGGNALFRKGDRFEDQFRNAEKAVRNILPLKKQKLIFTFGNAPQVGSIMIRTEAALGKAYAVPLYGAVAQSEGEIGLILSQILDKAFRMPVVSLLTRVLVDKNDPAFKKPSKPIGPFYKKRKAEQLKKKGFEMKKMRGGWRRVVASPRPLKILESESIQRIAKHSIVIAAGGGGIAVARSGGKLKAVDAVIDKDRASACLAKSAGAKRLILLTDVECAYLNFGKKNEDPIGKIKTSEAKKYISEGHFEEGSMLPKMEAAVSFAESGGTSIITSFDAAKKALRGKAGTVVTK